MDSPPVFRGREEGERSQLVACHAEKNTYSSTMTTGVDNLGENVRTLPSRTGRAALLPDRQVRQQFYPARQVGQRYYLTGWSGSSLPSQTSRATPPTD